MNATSLFTAAALTALSVTNADAGPRSFDVAEDFSRFVFAPQPVFEDGMPAYGNVFVTEGYIYPAGTLDGGVEGTLADGSPAFPDKVIGTWVCDGVFVGDGMRNTEGNTLISRQVYTFDDVDILISQGGEQAVEGGTFTRAVTGGTGDYLGMVAELRQTFLGMSDDYGVRLQLELVEGRSQAALAQ